MSSRQNRSSFPPSRTYSSPSIVSMPADGFLSDATLAGWVRAGFATRTGSSLRTVQGNELILTDALRILGRSDGESDPYSFTGKVISLRALLDRGALIHANGMKLGAASYDIELGYIVQAIDAAPAA
jgi:hypothetical protein